MRLFITILLAAVLAAATVSAVPAVPASASDWADATPTAWHQLARAESLLSAPEPPNPVAVCIVDSGVNITPDLEGVVIERLAYDGGDPGDTYPQDGIDDGHGTYVATFLAGQVNGWGGAGLWPRAKIVSVRVFPPGAKRASAEDYIRGLRRCQQFDNVAVVNLSLGGIDGAASALEELENRITELRSRHNINVVAAAGNGGGGVDIPARYPGAFAVGAIDADAAICDLSARGEGLDVLAPGCGLMAHDQQGRPVLMEGTSFAAPMVASILASLRSYAGLTAAQAEETLLTTAAHTAHGVVVDAARALRHHGIEWPLPSSSTPAPLSTTPPMPMNSEFLDYPRPRVRVRRSRQTGFVFRISNRPYNASVHISSLRTDREYAKERFEIGFPRRARWARARFISNAGASSWVRLRLPRR